MDWKQSGYRCGWHGFFGTTANGTLSFDSGTVDFNTMLVGYQGVSSGSTATGIVNVGTNAVLQVNNTLVLGATTGTVNPATSGTLNINTNGTLLASMITNGGAVSTINMTNATWSVAVTNATVTNMTVANFNAQGTANTINVNFITPVLPGPYPVRFHLINSPNLTGASTLSLVLPASYDPSHPYAGYLDTTSTAGVVDLVLTGGPASARSLTWTGLSSGSPNGTWDVGSTFDWETNGVATLYNQFDLATFTNLSNGGQSNVSLTTALTPYSVTVSNTGTLYTFGGGGSLSGAMALLKQGSGTLILDNSSANTFTGGVTISAGTLQIGTNDNNGSLPSGAVTDNGILAFDQTGTTSLTDAISGSGAVVSAGGGTLQLAANNSFTGLAVATNNSTLQGGYAGSFGSSSGTVYVASGSTLDANGVGTSRTIVASGNGVGGNGAIINSSSSAIIDSSGGLTPTLNLSNSVTFGFPSARWDLGSSTGATLSTGGNPYSITLDGSGTGNYFTEWRDLKTDTNLANIYVYNGDLGIAGSTSLGNPADILNIDGSAGIKFYNDDGFNVAINKQVVIGTILLA